MLLSRNQIITGIGAIVLVGIVWAGNFYYQNLRGIGPVVRPLASSSPEPMTSQNKTGLPLSLPVGFTIETFAKDLPNARVIAFDGFGNIWVSQPNQGTVSMLEIKNGIVVRQDAVFRNLRKPHGLAFDPANKNILYIAEEQRIVRAHLYSDAPLEKVVDLPTGGNHTSRTIGFGPDGRLYIAVGSTCNVCNETDWRRAKILVVNKDGTGLKEYAKGLRNSVFFTWHPITKEMWATEMGRDLLGDDLPPDEINIIKEGQNYGWPNCYGQNVHDDDFDPQPLPAGRQACQQPFEIPSLIDLAAHSAPLGLSFVSRASNWPAEYKSNLLVAYHGSWNRTVPTGYKIVMLSPAEPSPRLVIPLNGRKDLYTQKDFISGWFPVGGKGTDAALGRPVDLKFGSDGALYISDDKAGVIYRVAYTGRTVSPVKIER